MHTGCLKLAGVFLARAVSVNRKELKHLVFQKALNVLLTKTVAEIYNLVDPGVDTLRYINLTLEHEHLPYSLITCMFRSLDLSHWHCKPGA